MGNLAEALPEEINRVRVIQDHYKELRGMHNVVIEPQIAMMENSIQTAIKASSSGDVTQMLKSYADLKDYEE